MKIYEFTDAAFMTTDEKLKVLKAWVRFLKGGLQRKDFTKSLYNHLIMHASFIAHYSIDGFFDVYFSSPGGIKRFFPQFDIRGACNSVEYGGSWMQPEYEDINTAMVEEASAFIPNLLSIAKSA